MASSSSSSRLALRLCSSIRSSYVQQHSRAFAAAAASVCGETAKAAAGARAGASAASSASNSSSSAADGAASSSSLKDHGASSSSSSSSGDGRPLAYVFLGAPGVGKGTYSTRVADALGAEHISAGDLVRAEVKKGSELGKQVAAAVDRGDLVPDSLVTDLVKARLLEGRNSSSSSSSSGRTFVLDGFPRTASQASTLLTSIARVPLALNLTLREQVLVDKCLGRRVCGKCGKGYNVADIMLPACESTGEPAVVMPPMPPPRGCESLMEVRSDDNPATVRHRLGVYRREAAPLEAVFREAGVLVDFPVTGGVRETLPRLMEVFARAGAGGAGGDEKGGSTNNNNNNSGSSSGDEGQRAA